MKTLGNVSLGLALLLAIYPLIPNLPALRAAILRIKHGPLGPAYALVFVLMPLWLRLMLAAIALWNALMLAMVAAIGLGALDWTGTGRTPQYVLAGAACFAMGEITVLIRLTYDDPEFKIPRMVRAISPWAAYVLPLVVMVFAGTALNPAMSDFLSPWFFRVPLLAAVALALPMGAVLLTRWWYVPGKTAA